MAEPIQLLFNDTGPGVLVPVEVHYAGKTSDGLLHTVTHHIPYYVWGETVSSDDCARRVEEVFNHSEAWMRVGVRLVRTLDITGADVRIEFHDTRTWHGNALFKTWRTTFSTGRVYYTTKFIASRALARHEGMLHESGHWARAYHMDDAWPDYPYFGVMSGDGQRTDRWFSDHDARGLRNYKHGLGHTSPDL